MPASPAEQPSAASPATAGRALELMAAGAGLTLVFTFAASLGSWRAELGRLQALMAVAFAFFALALWRMAKWRGLPHAGLAVFVIALSMRLAVLPVVPTLSDDLWRYLWDGRVIAHGVNPYAHAPDDPALAALRDREIHPRINHPELRTIYPPLAEAGFAAAALVAPGVRGMKSWILLNDLAVVAVLIAWSVRRTGSAVAAIAYAWNPLVTLEYAGSAHHDPTGILWLVVALALAEERPLASATAFAASVLVKLAPLVALPILFAVWPWRARALAMGLLAAGLGGFAILAGGPGSGLAAYAAHWRNNELAFHYLASLLGDARARIAAVGFVGALAIGLAFRAGDAAGRTRSVLRGALLAGPVLHPWYLGWALALEPLSPSWPWFLLSALALLNYGLLASPAEGGAFHLGLAWRWVEYGAPFALAVLLWTIRRGRADEEAGRA